MNPLKQDIERAELDILVGASAQSIVMVEGEAKEVSETDMLEAIKIGHEAVQKHVEAQLKLAELFGGRKAWRDYPKPASNLDVKEKVYSAFKEKIYTVASSGAAKTERKLAFAAIKDELKGMIEGFEKEEDQKLAKKYYSDLEYDIVRNLILDEGKRLDGRKTDEIRPI